MKSSLNGKLRHPIPGHGYISINYALVTPDEKGNELANELWVYTHDGFRRKNAGTWGWTITEPDSETLMAAAACALGLMSPGVFADFLEERADELLPRIDRGSDQSDDEVREHFQGVISELRRIDPALAPTGVTGG